MRRALQRLLARPPQVFDRLADVIAEAVMTRQLAQVIVQLPGEHRLQRNSGALVQELAALDQQRVIGDLLRQRVLEDVFDIARGRLLVYELRHLQLGEHPLQLVVLLSVEYPPDERQGELPANYGERLQQLLLIGWQPINSRGKDRLYRGWDFHRVHRLGQLHGTVSHQHAIFEEGLHYLFHEEGIAAGAFDDETLESFDAVLHPHPSGDLKVARRPLPVCAWRLRCRRARGTYQRRE